MMFAREKQFITFADDQTIQFARISSNEHLEPLGCTSLSPDEDCGPLPENVRQSVNRLLVVPDYWLGNRVDALQAKKKSVIASFIERKLKQDPTSPPDAPDFYSYAAVESHDHARELYVTYLHEPIAYRVYRQLESLGCPPRRITSPALLWQGHLNHAIPGFGEKGIGFIHLCEKECYLYLYFKGQYIFSRNIQFPENEVDASQIYNQLNFEINQSSYLYAQKTKNSVDEFYVLTSDSDAAGHLTELLGREVKEISGSSISGTGGRGNWIPISCQSFSKADLQRRELISITHRPLKKELYWRPVQWAGVAVGSVLVVLLAVEAFYLHTWSNATERQISVLKAATPEPPEVVLQETSFAIEEIRQVLQRPSGSGTVLKSFLSEINAVSIQNLSLNLSSEAELSISANILAGDPAQFKYCMQTFLHRLNDRFQLTEKPLKENDVKILLNRGRNPGQAPVYQIHLTFGLPS
jgi:hypothetical protein